MATKVTIEGSRITPTDKLPRGVRTTVELTPSVQEFINRGFAVEISRQELPDEQPVEVPDGDQTGDSDADEAPGAGEADDYPAAAPDQEADAKPNDESAEKPSRGRRPKTTEPPEE
jgi:hypothetical protein